MKIKLIAPARKPEWGESFWEFRTLTQLTGITAGGPPLALITLAALTPADIDVVITDDYVEEIDYCEKVDLVGITFLTSLAPRAYEIADKFKARGVSVILGGIHASMLPDEAILHADSVVIGEAEDIWPKLVEDFRQGNLQKLYRGSESPNLNGSPIPRWDLLNSDNYYYFVVQTGRGCPNNCNFCSVTAFNGHRYRHKLIENTVEEIKNLQRIDPKKLIFFADDNLLASPSYVKTLLQAIKPLKIRAWWCQASINRLKEDRLLELMYQTGCRVVFVGFESVSQESLNSLNKSSVNKVEEYTEIVNKVHSHGIAVFGSFVLGGDWDGQNIFKDTIDFVQESNIPYPMFNILTPLPGTALNHRLEKEGRILHTKWEKYSTEFVCFKPKEFSVRDLQNKHALALQEVYSYGSLYKRFRELWKKGVFIRSREGHAKLFTKGRLLFTLKCFTWGDVRRSLFTLKSLWNLKVTSTSAITLALNFHDCAEKKMTLSNK